MTTLVEGTRPEAVSKPKLVVVTDNFQLNSSHRCDRCSHAAYYEVSLRAGNQLLFCMHHYRENEAALRPPVVVEVRDESKQLFPEKPTE